MTKTTRRAFLSSVVALIICLTMLIGTTFAWFTDTASTAVNTIKSGTLDVVLEVATEFETAADGSKIPTAWTEVTEDTTLFKNVNGDDILWEPGAGAEEWFRIRNNGNLALKYQFMTNYANATKTDDGKTLADVLMVQNVAYEIENGELGGRIIYQDITGNANTDGYAPMKNAKFEEYLLPGESRTMYVCIVWQPTDHDNDFNVEGGLSIDLGINVLATQYTYEYDSTDNKYDEEAGFGWDGTVATQQELEAVTDNENKTVEISTPNLLAAFAVSVNNGNNYLNYTVTLDEDLNLNNHEWTPIGTATNAFWGTFDGNGHTISNLKITSGANVGLFGHITLSPKNYTPGIKNLTINNVTIAADNSGAFVGNANTTTRNAGNGGALILSDLKLTGKVTIEGKNVGGIIGTEWTDFQIAATNITIDVKDGSYVKGSGVIGGVFASTPHGTVKNITSNMNVIASGDENGAVTAGGIVGCAGWTLTDVTCTGNVTVTNAAQAANDKYTVGKIVGKEANNPYWKYYGNTTKKYGSEFENFTANNTISITLTDNTALTGNGLTNSDKKGSLNLVDYEQSLVGAPIWDWLW